MAWRTERHQVVGIEFRGSVGSARRREIFSSIAPVVQATGREGVDRPASTEASVPALIAPDCSQEIDLAESGPLDITEIELTIGTLPQHEAGESHLPGGPDNQVGIGAVVRVEVLVHSPRGQGLENLVGAIAPTPAVSEMPFHRIHDLLPSSTFRSRLS
jgi:hypothetical protein